jgi:two-component system, response regulator YcbB
MNFYITDDDEAVRTMLTQIIEEEDIGEVVGEAWDGSLLDGMTLTLKKVDVLFIDLLMPIRDGIETIRQIKPEFNGKIIMLSQVESKDMIGEAYSLGIEHYITKPINKFEVLAVIQKVIERIRLEKSVHDIHQSLTTALNLEPPQNQRQALNRKKLKASGRFLLSELGIAGGSGSKDLLDILEYLDEYERIHTLEKGFPPLKEIFEKLVQKRQGNHSPPSELTREIKATEQRVRRAISQSLNHLASIGLADFSNLKFETYASKFFDFTVIRKKMNELKKETSTTTLRINTKKFIQVLYFEAKQVSELH